MSDHVRFLIRAYRAAAAGAEPLTGRVERVGTGEKADFGSSAELVAFIDRHVAASPTIGRPTEPRNAQARPERPP